MAGGGLKVGDVYVVVTAAVGEFTKSMRQVVKDVAETADKVAQLGEKIGQIGAVVSAGLYGALAAAASFDKSVTERMDRIKLVFTNVGAAIGDAVLPYLERLSDALEHALGWFQRLDPSVKEGIGSFLVWGTAAGLAGGALGKVAGVAKTAAEAFNYFVIPALGSAGRSVVSFSALMRGAGPEAETALKRVARGADQVDASFLTAFRNAAARVLLIGAPIAAVAAAVAALVLLAGALYKAWNDSSTGMRATFQSLWQTVAGWAAQAGEFFGRVFRGLADTVTEWARSTLDAYAFVVRNLARIGAPMARALNLEGAADALDSFRDLTGAALGGALKGLVTDSTKTLATGLGGIWEGVSYGAGYAFDGVKALGSDTADYLQKRFGDVFGDVLGGPKGILRKPDDTKEIDVASVGSFDATAFIKRASNTTGILEEIAIRKAKELADALARAADEAKQALTQKFTQAFGRVSDLIQDFQEGFAAGGIWGGIGAVAADLLSQSATFASLIQMATNYIQTVANVIGSVLAPVLPLVASVFNMVTPLLESLVPVLTAILAPLQAIAPVFELLGVLFRGLAPVVSILGQILVVLVEPLTLLAGPIMKAFFAVVRILAIGILYVIKGVGTVWNALVGFVQSVFKALSKIPLIGGAFKGMVKDLEKMKVPMDEVNGALDTLKNTSYESAAANSAASVATWQNAEATQRATEALTNVPQGFKVALARLTSQDPVIGSPTAPLSPSPLSPSPAAPVSGAGNVTVGQIVVEGVEDPEETARSVWNEIRREQNRRRGTSEWLTGRY
ncbi:hypothetical protein [Stigmatella aurantiaca]|uniref:Phage tail-like protein n=1 Tax=Stigmatella aurantiaca (strain DW4/3-1) TaxID=378806 RepID=Q096L0_STIAD|nr:hypothetical protein [Stigmatella aurantiaca]ADO68698.1 Phage tail-like protein [Stigmatella aurantiaca DW4/3-1]EAU67671.1 hypothetical protein STIAU_0598 [Stigmatella aurantiaca DW4/3-1]